MRRRFYKTLLYLLSLDSLLVLPSTVNARVEIQPCKNSYSPQQQIQLGQKASQQVYKQMPVLADSSPVSQYIQQLGSKLAAQAPLPMRLN